MGGILCACELRKRAEEERQSSVRKDERIKPREMWQGLFPQGVLLGMTTTQHQDNEGSIHGHPGHHCLSVLLL